MKPSRSAALLLVAGLSLPAHSNAWAPPVALWQELHVWDGLLAARDRALRQQADPQVIPVVKVITQQAAQQLANLQQIHEYVKIQQDNVKLALSERDPQESLDTIRGNFETLTEGAAQVRSNLYYLTARLRMVASQTLPDPELTKETELLIGQIQAIQLLFNQLYSDTVTVEAQVQAAPPLKNKFLKFRAEILLRGVTQVQNSVFAIYNSAYEVHVRSKNG